VKNILFVDYEKCTGCRLCEVACSFFHDKMFNPARARIQVLKWESQGIDVPIVCQHCEDAPCQLACPVNAIYRETSTGAISINSDLCIGCRMCMGICPFGCITSDTESAKVIKCDLCSGEPECVKYCTPKAIEYLTPGEAATKRKVDFFQKMLEVIKPK